MPKRINYQLTAEDLKLVEGAMQSAADGQVRQRATAIRMLHLGKTPAEVSDLLNVSLASVYNWHAGWRASGLAGLTDAARSGRPKVATDAYVRALREVIECDPTTLGYAFTVWTIGRLLAHLAQVTGITMSDESFRTVLAEQGYVYRRPKHDLKPLQDPQARATAQTLLDELKKRPQPVRSSYSLWTKPL
jgi:transposase